MLKILNQPYPFSEKSIPQIVFQSILEGLFVAFFLIVIEPFGLGNWQIENKNFYLFLYGIVTTVCVLILRIIVYLNFSKYQSQSNWTIFKEIISILSLISLITIGNYLLTSIVFDLKHSVEGFANMFFMVLVIGIFPTVFGVMANYLYHFKKYSKEIEVQTISTNQSPFLKEVKITLIAENEKDTLVIEPENLFYIESADNYSTIFFQKNEQLQKELIRSSLARLVAQINDKNIVRCHRSFIVNMANVQKVKGNAQGYKLHLDAYNLEVPVARKYSFLVENLK